MSYSGWGRCPQKAVKLNYSLSGANDIKCCPLDCLVGRADNVKMRNSASPSARIKNLDKYVGDLKHNIQKMRQAYWQFIESIITRPLKTQLTQAYFVPWNAFWQCIKSTRKDYTGVATLKVNGTIINDTKEKADQLNKHFESVFIHENTVQPDLLPNASPYPVAPEADGTRPRLTYHAPW